MTLHHNFKTKCHNLPQLFEKVDTFAKFCKNLEKQSTKDPIRYDSNKYLGDGFEFFIELFLKLHPNDNRIGIGNYIPNQVSDNGVDGIGHNINNEKCVVQVKFRSDKQEQLTATKDHLSNLFSDGMLTHNVVADTVNLKNYRHFIFTTASGLHFYTDNEMFKNKVKCFGYKELKKIVDKNVLFWNNAREIIVTLSAK